MDYRRLRVRVGDVEVTVKMDNSNVADMVWESTPITTKCNTWGDEIYFNTGLGTAEGDLQEVVEMADVAYWSPGEAVCLFFGKTPASCGDEIRPASAVIVFGKIEGDATILKSVPPGATVSLEKA